MVASNYKRPLLHMSTLLLSHYERKCFRILFLITPIEETNFALEIFRTVSNLASSSACSFLKCSTCAKIDLE